MMFPSLVPEIITKKLHRQFVKHMRKFVLETEILGSCKKQIRRFVLIKIKELIRHSISRETNRIINLAKPAD